jgi:hypothetical protein
LHTHSLLHFSSNADLDSTTYTCSLRAFSHVPLPSFTVTISIYSGPILIEFTTRFHFPISWAGRWDNNVRQKYDVLQDAFCEDWVKQKGSVACRISRKPSNRPNLEHLLKVCLGNLLQSCAYVMLSLNNIFAGVHAPIQRRKARLTYICCTATFSVANILRARPSSQYAVLLRYYLSPISI